MDRGLLWTRLAVGVEHQPLLGTIEWSVVQVPAAEGTQLALGVEHQPLLGTIEWSVVQVPSWDHRFLSWK